MTDENDDLNNFDDFDDEFEFVEDDVEETPQKTFGQASTRSNANTMALPPMKKMLTIGGAAAIVIVIAFSILKPSKKTITADPVTQPNASLKPSMTATAAPKAPIITTPTQSIATQTPVPENKTHQQAQKPTIQSDAATFEELFEQPEQQEDLSTALHQDETLNLNELQNELFGQSSTTNISPTSSPKPSTKDNQNIVLSKEDTMTSDNADISQVENLQNSIEKIQQALNKMTQSIHAMDSRVLGLTETVDHLSQDLGGIKKIIADEDLDLTTNLNKAYVEQPQYYTAPEYIVHAIIPGRAWLKNSRGQIITVTEGDTIGDYGKIAAIDAANAVVLTSSGTTFR